MKIKPPYFVFKTDSFKNNLESLTNAFKRHKGGFKVGYSFKTNPHPCVLEAALKCGCYAEVVSPYEYGNAISAGFPESHIIYNGVCKNVEQAVSCASAGGAVNVDSIDELFSISREVESDVYIGARLTFEIGNNVISRFGIPVWSDDFKKLISIDKSNSKVHIVGLSCHLTHARSNNEWRKRAETMKEAAKQFSEIKYIDLGGNMYSPMEKKFAENFPEHVSFDDYANVICPILDELNVELILETGTPLVANAMDLVCKVIGIKKNRDKTFIVVNTSAYDIGIVCRNTNLSYDVVKGDCDDRCFASDATIVGYTCIEDDVICENFSSPVAVGDVIVFHNVGAYSYSFASDFIMPKHNVIKARGDII